MHGAIAKDVKERLGEDFSVKAQGFEAGKEVCIDGRYYPKKVDITVEKGERAVAGYSVKVVVRNYAQNSNNYFENMLGETANIRVQDIPYFQIFIVLEKMPYYQNGEKLKKYDVVSQRNMDKYLKLSKDKANIYHHTPDKTLVVVIKLKEEENCHFANGKEYNEYYKKHVKDDDLMEYSTKIEDNFGDGVILNDYADFIERTYHLILGKLK